MRVLCLEAFYRGKNKVKVKRCDLNNPSVSSRLAEGHPHDFKAKVCGITMTIFADFCNLWWDSLEARKVFDAGRYLSCFRRQLLYKFQSPPEWLVLAQEGLLGWRVGRDSACLERWNLRNLDQLSDEWALNCTRASRLPSAEVARILKPTSTHGRPHILFKPCLRQCSITTKNCCSGA